MTPGPDFGRLKNGEAVLNCRQETVHPSDVSFPFSDWALLASVQYCGALSRHSRKQVMEPGQPGPAALILDCPHSTYLPALSSSPALRDLDPAALSVVIHLAPAEVDLQEALSPNNISLPLTTSHAWCRWPRFQSTASGPPALVTARSRYLSTVQPREVEP